ncbi:hypothetical protein SDC9_184157 [bioreactor metagenome]|uniref:Uncharacterized protein n=1 Tax=bioreactor metagenome TaxID=1076179 RepID=A0A645HC89_9ZZZZ
MAVRYETAISENPIMMPGSIPAIKSSPTEAPETTPYMTKGIDGGIITPIEPAAAVSAAAKSSSYIFAFMAGIMNDPIAETVAGPEPDIAAKNMQAVTVTIASPPMTAPTIASASETSLFDIPP